MLIFIYGEDTYRAHQKFLELLDGFSKKYDPSGLNTAGFRSGAAFGEVRGAATTPPFLAAKRLVALEGVWGKKVSKEDAEPWHDLLRAVPESTVMIVRENFETEVAIKHPIMKDFPPTKNTVIASEAKQSLHYAFPAMSLAEAASWIERETQMRSGKIEKGATQELLARVGTDSGALAHEIGKLVAYAHGRAVTQPDVETLVASGIEADVFATMDALSSRNQAKAAELLHGRLRAGDDEFYLLSMLWREVRILIMIKEALDGSSPPDRAKIAQTLKLHPFVVGKAIGHAARFSEDELQRLHGSLFAFDWAIKRGRMSPVMALDLFVAAV